MITIIYGDDIVASRQYFTPIIEKENSPLLLDGTKISFTEIMQILDGGDLFEEKTSLFIENFFTKRKADKEFEEIVAFLRSREEKATVVFWESKDLPKKSLSLFPKATVKHFALPKNLFSFLDAFMPGNGRHLVKLFYQVRESIETELVFFMIIRQFRLLVAVSDMTGENIDEAQKLASWQRSSLERQAKRFAKTELIRLYHSLYTIEHGYKTGTLGMTLPQAIDFFLIGI